MKGNWLTVIGMVVLALIMTYLLVVGMSGSDIPL